MDVVAKIAGFGSPAGNILTSRAFTSKADARNRTGDPFITSEVLYQLSYVGDSRAPV
jgi:hypothetical protein